MPSGDSINAAEQGVCPIRLVVVLMVLAHPLRSQTQQGRVGYYFPYWLSGYGVYFRCYNL